MYLSEQEWSELQSNSKDDKVYTDITEKNGLVIVAVKTNLNPFEDTDLFYPFEMLINEAKYVIESFQFLE